MCLYTIIASKGSDAHVRTQAHSRTQNGHMFVAKCGWSTSRGQLDMLLHIRRTMRLVTDVAHRRLPDPPPQVIYL